MNNYNKVLEQFTTLITRDMARYMLDQHDLDYVADYSKYEMENLPSLRLQLGGGSNQECLEIVFNLIRDKNNWVFGEACDQEMYSDEILDCDYGPRCMKTNKILTEKELSKMENNSYQFLIFDFDTKSIPDTFRCEIIMEDGDPKFYYLMQD